MIEALLARAFGVELARLAPVFLLVLARTFPLAFLAPWLSLRGAALAVRLAAALALALALTPLALRVAPPIPFGALPLGLLALREALVGAAFAVAASVPLYALSWTGALLDRQRGAAPASATAMGPLAALYLAAGIAIFAALGGPRVVVGALADSLLHLPPGGGASLEAEAFVLGAARLLTDALALCLALAAPLALALVIAELVTGLLGRVAPVLSRVALELPLRALLGLAVGVGGLAFLLPRLGPVFAGSIEAAVDLVRRAGP